MDVQTFAGGTAEMVIVNCPWCDAPAEITASALSCDACGVREELALDETPDVLVLAAA